jgi:hypothetical protein
MFGLHLMLSLSKHVPECTGIFFDRLRMRVEELGAVSPPPYIFN